MSAADRFEIGPRLGRGGMGEVYRALDRSTGRTVALKLLYAQYADDPAYLKRFEREVELARRAASPYVVGVEGYGVRDGAPYLVMEFVDGPTLREAVIQAGPLGWPRARAMLGKIARGLAAVHGAGVVHRDLKPSNILIAPNGDPKLSDFGIARAADLTSLTATSAVLGTPAYLPPEGARNERSDLYSLGVVGYELMAGTPPFEGPTPQEVILAHLRIEPDLARVPSEARRLIASLLAKDPADRPESATAVAELLDSGDFESLPVPKPPKSAQPRAAGPRYSTPVPKTPAPLPSAVARSDVPALPSGHRRVRRVAKVSGIGAGGLALLLVVGLIAGIVPLPFYYANQSGTVVPYDDSARAASQPPCPRTPPAPLGADESALVTLHTDYGPIRIRVEGRLAPVAAANFIALARCGFYDGTVFHGVIPTIGLIGGDGVFGKTPLDDPAKLGSGGTGYMLPDEPVTEPYVRGVVAFARVFTNGAWVPESQSGQFFIVHRDAARLPLGVMGQWTIFGKVEADGEGMAVVDAIVDAADGYQPTWPVTLRFASVESSGVASVAAERAYQ